MSHYFVYILASKRNGTLYVGSTSNLIQRIYQHNHEFVVGFTSKYHLHMLVYYEECVNSTIMVMRERQLKKWNREWKIRLIEEKNPEWIDLYPTIV